MRTAAQLVALALSCAVPPSATAGDKVFAVASEPADTPWWRRGQWQPHASSVNGVPIKRLHPQWCGAVGLSRQPLEAAVGAAEVEQALAGRSFVLEGHFDGGAAPQIAFVGAYRRCAGEQGLFAAIVEPATAGRMRMRFLVEVPEPASALALLDREPDGTLAVWWCADCSNGNRIAFNRERREFYVAGPASRRQ